MIRFLWLVIQPLVKPPGEKKELLEFKIQESQSYPRNNKDNISSNSEIAIYFETPVGGNSKKAGVREFKRGQIQGEYFPRISRQVLSGVFGGSETAQKGAEQGLIRGMGIF